MASCAIRYEFADGGALAVCVEGSTSYPQALAELKRTALDTYHEAMTEMCAQGDE